MQFDPVQGRVMHGTSLFSSVSSWNRAVDLFFRPRRRNPLFMKTLHDRAHQALLLRGEMFHDGP
jgi:hypothetical protein